jgi:hypothetical protein
MRLRNTLFLSALSALLVLQLSHATAAEKRLSSGEIAAAIKGNTVLGEYEGDPYAQYFDPNGKTIFQLQDGRSFEGDWYVDAATERYCSYHWMRGAKCYEVFEDGADQLTWLEEGTTEREETTLVEGRKLFNVKPKIIARPTSSKQ